MLQFMADYGRTNTWLAVERNRGSTYKRESVLSMITNHQTTANPGGTPHTKYVPCW